MYNALVKICALKPSGLFLFSEFYERLQLPSLTDDQLAVLGDAHGNWFLILFGALAQGLIDLNALETDATLQNEMKELLGEEATNIHPIDYFFSYLFKLSQHPVPTLRPFTNKKIFIDSQKRSSERFLKKINQLIFYKKNLLMMGDLFGDRGPRDDWSLYVIEKLKHCLNHLSIVISNHDMAFLLHHFNGLSKTPYKEYVKPMNSLKTLEPLIAMEGIDVKKMNNIIENVLIPSLKLVHYEIVDNTIVLFTHAPFPFHRYRCIAEFLGIPFSEETSRSFLQSLDAMNARFIELLKLRSEKIFSFDAENNPEIMRPEHPLYLLIWARWRDYIQDDSRRTLSVEKTRMADFFHTFSDEFSLHYVYGHTSEPIPEALKECCTCLDHYFGKGAFNPEADLSMEEKSKQQTFPIYRAGQGYAPSQNEIINLEEVSSYKSSFMA